MKKLIMCFILLAGIQAANAQDFPLPEKADYPEISVSGKRTADFVPSGWKIIGETKGDLNGDKIPDAALAIIGTSAEFITKGEFIQPDGFDSNPRMLIVLFGEKDGYKLAEKSNSMIAAASGPQMEEPFDSIEIKNGILQITQHIFMNAGGWSTSSHIYKFRFQKSEFALIGVDYNSVRRNSGEVENRSYNFLTRKVRIEKGSISNNKTRNTMRSFKPNSINTLKTFPIPFEYEIEKDFYL